VKLYLVRHAAAAEKGTPGMIDEDRPLIQKGRDRMKEVARVFKETGEVVDRIVTSPLVRSVQTAEVLAAGLAFNGEVEVTRLLAPGALPEELEQFVARAASFKGMVLVGHEPGMSDLARHFLGRTDFGEFKKGALCIIDFSKGLSGRPGKFGGMLLPKSMDWVRTVQELAG
jgi:phosphohistidine phosphatase